MDCHYYWAEVVDYNQPLMRGAYTQCPQPVHAEESLIPETSMLGLILSPNERQGICSQSLQEERNCSHFCRTKFLELHPKFRGGLGILRHQEKNSGARNQQERDTIESRREDRPLETPDLLSSSIVLSLASPQPSCLHSFSSELLISQRINQSLKCV